jgi:hypothetical protein
MFKCVLSKGTGVGTGGGSSWMGYLVDIRRYLTNDSLYICVDGCICLMHDTTPVWHFFFLFLPLEVTSRSDL